MPSNPRVWQDAVFGDYRGNALAVGLLSPEYSEHPEKLPLAASSKQNALSLLRSYRMRVSNTTSAVANGSLVISERVAIVMNS